MTLQGKKTQEAWQSVPISLILELNKGGKYMYVFQQVSSKVSSKALQI